MSSMPRRACGSTSPCQTTHPMHNWPMWLPCKKSTHNRPSQRSSSTRPAGPSCRVCPAVLCLGQQNFSRSGLQELDRVRMLGVVEDFFGGAGFDDPALGHDGYMICDAFHHM